MARIPRDFTVKLSNTEKLAVQKRFDEIQKQYDKLTRKIVGDTPTKFYDPNWSLHMSAMTHSFLRSAAYVAVMQGMMATMREASLAELKRRGVDLGEAGGLSDIPEDKLALLEEVIHKLADEANNEKHLNQLESDAKRLFDQWIDRVVDYFIKHGAEICDLTRGPEELN